MSRGGYELCRIRLQDAAPMKKTKKGTKTGQFSRNRSLSIPFPHKMTQEVTNRDVIQSLQCNFAGRSDLQVPGALFQITSVALQSVRRIVLLIAQVVEKRLDVILHE